MTIPGWLLLLPMVCRLSAADTVPGFGTQLELEAFLFPDREPQATNAIKTAFILDHASGMISTVLKLGPAEAARTAATIKYPEFRGPYSDLAKYLHLFGPCQKKRAGDSQGWWSNYPSSPGDAYCAEVTKLLLANLLWSQVHYCRQLVNGEAKPRASMEKGPPWRLDEPPVKTFYLNTDVLYSLADAALKVHFEETLTRRLGEFGPNDSRLQTDCTGAVAELTKEKPSRELVALELGKVLIRRYEAVHMRQLAGMLKKK